MDFLLESCGKVLITYTSRTTTFNSSTRVNVSDDTSYNVYALKSYYKSSEIQNSGGVIDDNYEQIIIRASDISVTPTFEDIITINSISYEITSFRKIDDGPDNLYWIFDLRR